MLSSLAPLSGRPRRDNASGCGRAYAPRLAPFFAVAGLFLAQLETDRAGADPLFDGGRVSGPDLVRRIEAARSSALWSRENPVRVHMPAGQQAYLSRLRCGTGAPAEFAASAALERVRSARSSTGTGSGAGARSGPG